MFVLKYSFLDIEADGSAGTLTANQAFLAILQP
jgi:hypothetical protein